MLSQWRIYWKSIYFYSFFFRKLTQTTWLQDRSALLRHWHEEVGAIPAMASENCWKIGGKTTLSHGLCRFIIHGMGYTMGYKEEIHGLYLIHVFFSWDIPRYHHGFFLLK